MQRPTIYTLEGYAESGMAPPFHPTQSYYQQKFETMGAWYEVWRPSQLKKTAAVVGVVAGAAASVIPGGQALGIPLMAVSAGAMSAAGASAAIHETYRDKSGNEIKVPQGQEPPPGSQPVKKKGDVAAPVIVGVLGALAALAIA